MERWRLFLDSLATAGGAIFLLLVSMLVFTVICVHILHHPSGFSVQIVTAFIGMLTGFQGALLGALSSRSNPKPNGNTISQTDTVTQTQTTVASEPPKV